MRPAKIALLVLLLATQGSVFSQDQEEKTCNNFHSTPASHKCECAKAMKCEGDPDTVPDDGQMDFKKCVRGYCKKDNCKCVGPCETMNHMKQKHGKACKVKNG